MRNMEIGMKFMGTVGLFLLFMASGVLAENNTTANGTIFINGTVITIDTCSVSLGQTIGSLNKTLDDFRACSTQLIGANENKIGLEAQIASCKAVLDQTNNTVNSLINRTSVLESCQSQLNQFNTQITSLQAANTGLQKEASQKTTFLIVGFAVGLAAYHFYKQSKEPKSPIAKNFAERSPIGRPV